MFSTEFNPAQVKDECVQWIRDWFEKNGKGCNAVIGISGGKDSTIAAALCIEALGADRVIGVLMPDGNITSDYFISEMICEHFGIRHYTINIGKMNNALTTSLWNNFDIELSEQMKINAPARLRMVTLYAISQCSNGRVVNTCNKSEDWVGYATKYGDGAGDFSPLSNLLVREVKAIGYELGLPTEWIEKTPTDGLCGKTDEDNLGFTYEMLDAYIGDGILPPQEIKEKIDTLHKNNLFKLLPMEAYKPKSAE